MVKINTPLLLVDWFFPIGNDFSTNTLFVEFAHSRELQIRPIILYEQRVNICNCL